MYLYYAACPAASLPLLRQGVMHAYSTGLTDRMTAFSYCYEGGGAIFYSTMFVEYGPFVRLEYQAGYGSPSCANVVGCLSQTYFLENAIYVFANDNACPGSVSPPTCPTDVVLSHPWISPKGTFFNVSLTSVPIWDPNVPGWISITDVQFYDTPDRKPPTMPLAEWTPGRLTGEATVSRFGQWPIRAAVWPSDIYC
jgi:hypothetical protein